MRSLSATSGVEVSTCDMDYTSDIDSCGNTRWYRVDAQGKKTRVLKTDVPDNVRNKDVTASTTSVVAAPPQFPSFFVAIVDEHPHLDVEVVNKHINDRDGLLYYPGYAHPDMPEPILDIVKQSGAVALVAFIESYGDPVVTKACMNQTISSTIFLFEELIPAMGYGRCFMNNVPIDASYDVTGHIMIAHYETSSALNEPNDDEDEE